ncbi:hypothetical protein C2S51_007221 [Perilla frutescens var. frutescens]|nr:hypothetical protein C2S51_007221 [Perilla frutescens var. frutescens]
MQIGVYAPWTNYEKVDDLARWFSMSVAATYFASLERCSCVNLTTFDTEDDDEEEEAKDRPLMLTSYPSFCSTTSSFDSANSSIANLKNPPPPLRICRSDRVADGKSLDHQLIIQGVYTSVRSCPEMKMTTTWTPWIATSHFRARVLEFEAYIEGIYRTMSENSSLRTGEDEAETKWELAQNNMESASSGLVFAANDLSVASINSKCASGDVFPLKIISDATNSVN